MSLLENVDDRLSRLPDEIVSHILSLMPTKFAVRTSILSKRWRCNWMSVTNLDFDDNHVPDLDKLTRFVDGVLESCKSPQVELFRLHLIKTVVPESCASKWIDRAVSLNVREFDIALLKHDLPLSLFTCKTLTKLRLVRTDRDFDGWECPCSVNLPCLKTLDIFAYTDSFVNAFKLISGCPVLESLSIEVQWSTEGEDCIFKIPTLKQLRLTLECPSHINKVVLDLPNLESLFVGGDMCSSFVMKDVSSLVEASVSFSWLSYDRSWDDLLKGLNGVKSLSAQIDRFTFYGKPLCSVLPVFTNMKRMELKGFSHSRLIHQFLEMSPQLKHLRIENTDDQLGESSWIEPVLVPACMLSNLTTIKFSKCRGWKCDIQLLEFMLGNAEVLKTVTITWENLKTEEKTRLRAQLLKVPRASQYCEISFL